MGIGRWDWWLGIAVAALVFAGPALAQHGGGRGSTPHMGRAPVRHEAPLEKFERMSPQEREQAMAALPEERRKKLDKQLKQYDQLTPAQKSQLDWFNHLAPDGKEAFRKAYQKFAKEPPERQQAIRDEMSHLTALPKSDRQARLNSPEFRARFNKNEQQILGTMSEALPHD